MNNNEILFKLRYALDITEVETIEIFKMGGTDLPESEIQKRLNKSHEKAHDKDITTESVKCSNAELSCFLNGLIIFKRGAREQSPDQPVKAVLVITDNTNVNNILLKKAKIALSLSSDDMLNILKSTDAKVNKIELGDLFRNEGHRKYKACSDKVASEFLRGLTLRYRK